MEKLQHLLSEVADKLGLNGPLLARAQRSYRNNRHRAYAAHRDQQRKQARADRYRREGHPASAARCDREAERLGHVAYENHIRAQHFLGVVKKLTQRIEKLQATQTGYETDLKNFARVTIKGNHAEGGSKRDRLVAVALKAAAECAAGHRANFYSQPGAWDIDHCITGERYGERSDCSSFVTSIYKAAGLADPNGERYSGGYTGTLVAHGRQVPHPEPGDLVIYGSGTGHHVEMYVGPGNKTIGHGSAPVDAGIVDLFGDGDYRFFSYV